MKKLILPFALLLVATGCEKKSTESVAPSTNLQAQTADQDAYGSGYGGNTAAEQKAIQRLLDSYGAALNTADAAKITALFTSDGVFLAPGSPTATGQAQIQGAFNGLFGAVALNLQFTPAQIVVGRAGYAFATSTSSGTLTPKATGQAVPSSYRELWAFTKKRGQWKIARYMFNQPQQ